MRGMTRCADGKGVKIMTKQDPHSRITDRILAELEQGTRPWLKPWSGGNMWIGVQKGPRYGGDRRLKGTPISMV